MARPVRRGGKWRIRWFGENGVRRSEVHDEYRVAQGKLREHEVEVESRSRSDGARTGSIRASCRAGPTTRMPQECGAKSTR